MLLPYIPGDYDSLAVTLSTMAQLLGIAGMLLVPIGTLWLIYESMKRLKKDWKFPNKNKTHGFAIAALVASGLIAIVTSLGAFANNNLSLCIITLVVCVYIVSKFAARLKQMKKAENRNFNPTPFYLIFIPIVVVFIRFMFITPAIELSRNYAIRQSEKLIQDIEAYHAKNGHYPSSLLSLWKDYKPSVIGIKQFHYEPYRNAYNLCFEQFSNQLGIREIVMYNKLNEQDISSHDSDLLVLSPEDIILQRGHIAAYDLPNPHWKYFCFD